MEQYSKVLLPAYNTLPNLKMDVENPTLVRLGLSGVGKNRVGLDEMGWSRVEWGDIGWVGLDGVG